MSTPPSDPTFSLVCQLVSRLTRHTQALEPDQRLIDDLGLDSGAGQLGTFRPAKNVQSTASLWRQLWPAPYRW